jgi:hypothetical protein
MLSIQYVCSPLEDHDCKSMSHVLCTCNIYFVMYDFNLKKDYSIYSRKVLPLNPQGRGFFPTLHSKSVRYSQGARGGHCPPTAGWQGIHYSSPCRRRYREEEWGHAGVSWSSAGAAYLTVPHSPLRVSVTNPFVCAACSQTGTFKRAIYRLHLLWLEHARF